MCLCQQGLEHIGGIYAAVPVYIAQQKQRLCGFLGVDILRILYQPFPFQSGKEIGGGIVHLCLRGIFRQGCRFGIGCLIQRICIGGRLAVRHGGIPLCPVDRGVLFPHNCFNCSVAQIGIRLFAAAVFALILIAVVTAVASGAISRPVEQLAEAMDETQLRHLNQRVTVTGSDEIARLGNSFNTLMDKLELAIYNEYETALQQKNAEIRALQAQMNPHFLYNVLQSMAAMADLHQIPELSVMAAALGKTLRYNISGKEPLVTLRDEIAHAENYLTIQKIRFGDRLHDQVNVPEYVMDHLVPRVSIQPMVENAIIHGFESSGQTGNISISAWEEKRQLIIEVADDGRGIPEDQLAALQAALEENSGLAENQGIGIQNLNTRLRLLYGAAGTLTIDSEEGTGTVVHIIIPVDGG